MLDPEKLQEFYRAWEWLDELERNGCIDIELINRAATRFEASLYRIDPNQWSMCQQSAALIERDRNWYKDTAHMRFRYNIAQINKEPLEKKQVRAAWLQKKRDKLKS